MVIDHAAYFSSNNLYAKLFRLFNFTKMSPMPPNETLEIQNSLVKDATEINLKER